MHWPLPAAAVISAVPMGFSVSRDMPSECTHHAVHCIYLQLRDAAENGKAADVERLLKSGANTEVKEDWVRVSARLRSCFCVCDCSTSVCVDPVQILIRCPAAQIYCICAHGCV